ncbi:MAG: hypothetical protein HY236_12390 [Acidobacteria bacterium]|nr:hypothetical protein [Acidobacteriota bacterium]
MEISNRRIWQQAAGDTDRDYSDICLKWDIILNGPGHLGPWPMCESALRDEGWSPRKITDLRRFAVEMADGDLVILRMGTSKVLAVGQVVGPYLWCDEFGDIDGWRLQHVRRVRWLWKDQSSPKTFDTYALKLGDTTQLLAAGSPVEGWLGTLDISHEALTRPLPELPEAKQTETSIAEISEYLFDHGVASVAITNLVSEIGELTRIAKWYQRSSKPSEHETVAYLVVPLLRALGWTPQRMGVEWNSVDVALFERLPRSDATLQIVVEGKKMDNSCLTAKPQAMSYAHGKSGCHRLIVTDGLRYGVYVRRTRGTFGLYAYLNLTRLRRTYPAIECRGAEEALLAMAPEWKPAEEVEIRPAYAPEAQGR